MSWIDVAILALVVLIGLIGIFRGVKKSALDLAAFLISFLLAFFLANVIAEALLGIDGVRDFVLGTADGKTWSLAMLIENSQTAESSKFLTSNFFKPMLDVVNAYCETNTAISATRVFAMYGAFMMFSALCGVGIFIVVRILLMIVSCIIKSYIGKKKTVVSRLFGFVIGAIRGALWAFGFTLVFSCLGGYTFILGVREIQNEYENNAVVCNYFNDGAYALRNSLFLPDKDTCGRLVEMVYSNQPIEDPDAETLSGDRLYLFVNVSNLNYDNSPWTVDEDRKRNFDDANASVRVASEFMKTEFDTVAKAILDYNSSIADLINDTTELTDKDMTPSFATLNALVQPNSNIVSIDSLMNELWAELRAYELHYNDPDMDAEVTVRNSTLSADYNAIKETLQNLKAKFAPFETEFGAFPELELPALKSFAIE